MTKTELRIWDRLRPVKGDSVFDRTERIAQAENYQNAADWFRVPEGREPLDYWRNHKATGKWFQVIGSSTRVLDLGCGVGWPTFVLAPFVKEIIGIDASPQMIEHARRLQSALDKKGNTAFEVCDATRMSFKEGYFDAVVSDNMIDVADSQKLALSEVFRVLRPGGSFALDFESYKTRLGDKGMEELLTYENYRGTPRVIYRVLMSTPSYLEREYILNIDPRSGLGQEILSKPAAQLKQFTADVEEALSSACACRFWESVHHDNLTMSALLAEAGFADITGENEGFMVCRRPSGSPSRRSA